MRDSTTSFAPNNLAPQLPKTEAKMVILGVKKDRSKYTKNKVKTPNLLSNELQTCITKPQIENSIDQMITNDYDDKPTPAL